MALAKVIRPKDQKGRVRAHLGFRVCPALMKMQRMICLDIHGVCCDFVGGFLRWNEISHVTEETWPKGEYDLELVTGHKISELPQSFWEELQPTKDFEDITSLLKGRAMIAASKVFDRNGAFGTYAWYLKHFECVPFMPCTLYKGNYFTHEVILIDDCQEEIDAWPGPSILVPRPWNKATGDPVEVVRQSLITIEQQDVDRGFLGRNSLVPKGTPLGP